MTTQVSFKNISITLIKALGILLMVLGHCGCPLSWLVNIIYMFHMPIFFFASGYCYNEKYTSCSRVFFEKKIKSLWIPFVKWGGVFVILHNVFYHLNLYSEYNASPIINHIYSFQDIIIRLCGVLTFQFSEPLLGGYWFLGALFFGTIIAYVAIKISNNNLIGGCVLVVILLIVNHLQGASQLLGMTYSSQYFMAALFYFVGRYFKIKEVRPFALKYRLISYLLIIVGSNLWLLSLGAHYYVTWKIIPYFISAVLCVWSIYSYIELTISTDAKNEIKWYVRFLNFIGNNTLPILTWHFLSFKIVSLFIIILYKLPINTLASHPTIKTYSHQGWWLVYFIFGTFVPIAFVYLRTKYIERDRCLN